MTMLVVFLGLDLRVCFVGLFSAIRSYGEPESFLQKPMGASMIGSTMSTPNYITPGGVQKLKDELEFLMKKDRPKVVATVAWAASNGDRSENADYIYGKKRLREIDRRMRWLTKRIEAAQVVDPKQQSATEKVVFGATVTIEGEDGEAKTYQIVGEDEIDTKKGKISWKSPLAKALLGKLEGDEVKVRKPKGDAWVEIAKVRYI